MRNRYMGFVAGMLVSGVIAFPSWAGKLDEWKKYRADIKMAMTCEKAFVERELAEIAANPDMSGDSGRKLNLDARQAIFAGLSLSGSPSNKECDTALLSSLERYFNGQSHKKLEDVEGSLRSSIGNYLLGRWGTFQSILGKGDRVLTTRAFMIKDRLQQERGTQIRFPKLEFGRDPAVIEAAKSDDLLNYWISLGPDMDSPNADHVANAIDDIYRNFAGNDAFSYDKTTFELLKESTLGDAFEKIMVAHIDANAIKAAAVKKMQSGEATTIVNPATYSVVYFKPVSFTATECKSYVKTGSWKFSQNGLSPIESCTSLGQNNVSVTPYPVAMAPETAKQLKVGTSNVNCMRNAPFIPVTATKDKQVLSTYTIVFDTEKFVGGKWTTVKNRKVMQLVETQASDADTQNADGSRKVMLAKAKTPDQYDNPQESFLAVCVPLTVYDGFGDSKKLVSYYGVSIN